MGAKIIRAKHPEYEQTLSFLQRSSVAGQGQDQLEDSHFGGNMLASFGREGAVHKRGGKKMDLFIFASFLVCMVSSWYRERYLSSLFDQAWLCALCDVCLLERCEY